MQKETWQNGDNECEKRGPWIKLKITSKRKVEEREDS